MEKKTRSASHAPSAGVAEAVPDTKRVGERLVALCREGKNFEAIEELYADDVVSVEAQAPPEMPATMTGLDAIRRKNGWWFDNNSVHSARCEGPLVNGDRFAVHFRYEFTPKAGEGKGQRTKMEEIALYTVRDGKVVHEAFFS